MRSAFGFFVTISIAIHVGVGMLIVYGGPNFARAHFQPPRRIAVGIVAATGTKPVVAKAEPKKTEQKVVQAKKEVSVTPPKPKPAPRTPDTKVVTQKPKPEQKVVALKADPAPPKPADKKKPEPKTEEDFSALLKNIAPPPKKAPEPQVVADPDRFASIIDSFAQDAQAGSPDGNVLDPDEFDAWRAQVGSQFKACWSIPSGASGIGDIAVSMRVQVGGDLSIRQATIMDTARMQRDPVFRVAAERARWALLDPRCNPLPKPPLGLDIVNETITFNFDPKAMFGE